MRIKTYNRIYDIKEEWIKLEAQGGGCVFQYYCIEELIFKSHILKLFRHIKPIYKVVIDEEERILIIAPLMKVKGKYHSISGFHGADYYDFIYNLSCSREILSEALCFLLSNIDLPLEIDLLTTEGVTISLLKDELLSKTCPSVKVYIHDDYNEYYQSLNKHVRQNIRTAYNRVKKDERSFEVQLLHGALPTKVCKECMDVYNLRRKRRYKSTSFIKTIYTNSFDFISKMCNTMSFSENIILRIDGAVAAYMSGIKDKFRNGYYVIRVAINDDYSKYSPGILLINEAVKAFSTGTIKWMDFGGSEGKYKKDMGGIEVERYKLSI